MKIYRKTEKDFKDYAAELMENDILAVCDVNTEPFADEILRRLSEYGKESGKILLCREASLARNGKIRRAFRGGDGTCVYFRHRFGRDKRYM